ncbi:hypothetical protein D3C72_2466410 [compost metagenome]
MVSTTYTVRLSISLKSMLVPTKTAIATPNSSMAASPRSRTILRSWPMVRVPTSELAAIITKAKTRMT